MLYLIARILFRYDLGSELVKTSLVTFSSEVEVNFYLNNFTSTFDAIDAVLKIFQPKRNTYTDKGLKTIREEVFSVDNGARDGSAKVVLVFTDGVSSDRDQTLEESRKLHEAGVIVIAVGIASGDEQEIRQMASDAKYALMVDDFKVLSTLQGLLGGLLCSASVESLVDEKTTLLTETVPTTTMTTKTSTEATSTQTTFILTSGLTTQTTDIIYAITSTSSPKTTASSQSTNSIGLQNRSNNSQSGKQSFVSTVQTFHFAHAGVK